LLRVWVLRDKPICSVLFRLTFYWLQKRLFFFQGQISLDKVYLLLFLTALISWQQINFKIHGQAKYSGTPIFMGLATVICGRAEYLNNVGSRLTAAKFSSG